MRADIHDGQERSAPRKGRIQKSKTSRSRSADSTCNARPVNTNGSCVDGALRSSTFWRGDDCGRVQSHVSGLSVQPFFTTAGPDVVREVGPDHFHGLDAP